jgi:hypothetical protein
MKIRFNILIIFFALLISNSCLKARLINADPNNYTSFLPSLSAGDTLFLAAGTYKDNLTLKNINGTESDNIVIMGSPNLYKTIIVAEDCCNTVSITQCSYLTIKNLELNGMNIAVDALKAEGTNGNWAHHITIEYLNIINYGNNQQIVGISTKCHAWNWIIRKNRIIGAGTGMYLGNSDGGKPFVNGIIENNLIMNTIGYNIEIKHQLNGVRDAFPGTALDGKSIIRHNVMSKEKNASTGSSARPVLLVGGFPLSGYGSNDYYEIYGNFIYQNPEEALFQGTGNIIMYNNIFVNHSDGKGFRAVYITPQNGVQPQIIKFFHNTVWTNNSAGAVRLYNPNTNYKQYCYGNAVFSANPISGYKDTLDNITDTYANPSKYLNSPTLDLSSLVLIPKLQMLNGDETSSDLFESHNDWDKDFNGNKYNWKYRGAYSTDDPTNIWKLQLDTMPSFTVNSTGFNDNTTVYSCNFFVYPNPITNKINIGNSNPLVKYILTDLIGNVFYSGNNIINQDFSHIVPGMYLLRIQNESKIEYIKIIKQ